MEQLRNALSGDGFEDAARRAVACNDLFTLSDIDYARQALLTQFLDPAKVAKWLSRYSLPTDRKRVGVVMAGNIPMVGFGDLFCVLMCGYEAVVKFSSKDTPLMRHVTTGVAGVTVCDSMPRDVDMLLTMGGDDAAQFFGNEFAHIPTLIRASRHSVAIVDGCESDDELALLADDISLYGGLGCRNVTHIYIPVDFPLSRLPRATVATDNYRYQRALHAAAGLPFEDMGGYILVEAAADQVAPPLGVVYYSRYAALPVIDPLKIQCVVGRDHIPFGASQRPTLADYPDGKDVMQFLIGRN